MNKIELAFLISHLKKAIWNLECANKLRSDTIDNDLLLQLKVKLSLLENMA